MNLFLRLICLLLVSDAFAPSVRAQSSRPLPRRENIILIVATGLGYRDLSCYGQTKFETPNLDKLAARGVRIANYSAGDADPGLAMASLLLGRSAAHLSDGAGLGITLTAGDVTIAQLLKESGYHTGLIGEWLLGDGQSSGAPWLKGFDEFAGYFNADDANNAYADFILRCSLNAVLNPANNQMETVNRRETVFANTGGKKGRYIPDLLTQAAMNFAKNNQPDRFNHYRPFFLLLDYTIPGDGYREVPSDAPFSEEPWPQPEKNRAAMISRLDGYIGQLLERLAGIGQTSNTLILFTSDTVPQRADGVDPAFFHENLSPRDFRVPLIACWPGNIPAGVGTGKFSCSAKDFLPTAAVAAYVEPPANIDGVSFLPALLGKGSD